MLTKEGEDLNEELIKDKLETCKERIDDHSTRIDKIEQIQAQERVEIENLCKSIDNLTSVLKWIVTGLGGSFIAFFFYAIQHFIFK